MPSIDKDDPGRTYWRSLDELAETPAFRGFLEQEFPGGAWECLDATSRPDEASRRQFLKVMGASLALAGMTGCRWPTETILPYANRPEGRTPGVPERYATAMEIGGVATGLLATSYDGRPIKIEGNPSHPFSLGATSAIHQASVLELYDPDRSRTVVRREGGQTIAQAWDEFAAFAKSHFADLRKRGGKGLHILIEATSSPSVADMRARLTRAMPQARWYEYEPISWDNERAGTKLVFGASYRPHLLLDKASVIVCLDADPLMTHPAAVRYARDFAKGRRAADGRMNRLYAVESVYSVTGSVADHRLAIASVAVSGVACRLAGELVGHGLNLPKADGATRAKLARTLKQDHPAAKFVAALAGDLMRNKGRSVILAGPRQPGEVHAIAHVLNAALGNVGKTIRYTAEPDPGRPSHVESITSLARAIQKDQVGTLLILGGNPAFDAPADVEFAKHLGKAKTSIHLSLYDNETSGACTWHVPRAHYLESWGDARAYNGTISIVQPLIEPLYGGKTPAEVLAMAVGDPPVKGHEIVRRAFGRLAKPKDPDRAWRRALHDGVVPDTAWPAARPRFTFNMCEWMIAPTTTTRAAASSEIVFCQDHGVYDGRFANNGWLQEWPDPMMKLTWDNAATVSPTTARSMGVSNGDVLELNVDGRKLAVPAYVMPGQADGSVAVSLGYGRRRSGRVGDGVGVDVYRLRGSRAMGFATGVQVAGPPAGVSADRHAFAATQDQHPITPIGTKEQRRRVGKLILEADLADYQAHPDFARHAAHHPRLESLWIEHAYGPHRWAMAIDLSVCTGCGSCVTACQAENNIPVVGKAQVARGREMHWIRVDRYFSGDPDAPSVLHQPVMCVHCENAPCEQVCPVAATVHDREGLNVMIYNRCVGTRYCSNNCPFKVRRFNFFNYRTGLSDTEKMVMNPEVTVRSRGVMEKCTYCLQRIRAVKVRAKNERRPIRDGEIVPACAQACPTRAIVFGDLNDEHSEVRRLQASGRSYRMLAELNVKPRTAYLAKLRNPNAALTGDEVRTAGPSKLRNPNAALTGDGVCTAEPMKLRNRNPELTGGES